MAAAQHQGRDHDQGVRSQRSPLFRNPADVCCSSRLFGTHGDVVLPRSSAPTPRAAPAAATLTNSQGVVAMFVHTLSRHKPCRHGQLNGDKHGSRSRSGTLRSFRGHFEAKRDGRRSTRVEWETFCCPPVKLTMPQKDLIQVPFVPRFRTLPPELLGILSAKFPAPLADRLIRHGHPTGQE